MSCSWDPKDPDEVLDYGIDWQDTNDPCLEIDETIVTSNYSVVEGTVVIDSQSNTDTTTKVWLSGGTDGERCKILNRITTSANRTYDHTVILRIRSH